MFINKPKIKDNMTNEGTTKLTHNVLSGNDLYMKLLIKSDDK